MNRFAAFSLSAILLASTAACSSTGGITTFNTSELNADAGAIAYAVQAIEAIPAISANLTDEQRTRFNALIAEIRAITAQIAANSNGSISVNTGNAWAKSLGSDLSELLSIAAPIVQAFDPGASGYMATAQEMVPLVEALTGLSVQARATTTSPAQVRARVYFGVS